MWRSDRQGPAGEEERAARIPAARSEGGVAFCDGKDLVWYGLRGLEGLARLDGLITRARDAGKAG